MLLPHEQSIYKRGDSKKEKPILASDEHHSTFTGSLEHSISRPTILIKEHRHLGIMQLGFHSIPKRKCT
jgi:hypothetical protein